MERRIMAKFAFVLVFGCILIFSTHSSAKTTQEILSEKYAMQNDIAFAIKSAINEGLDARAIVRTAIKMKHKACDVIHAALEAGANSEQVISGALESGLSPDVVARCGMEAEVKPEEIAWLLEEKSFGTELTISRPAQKSRILSGTWHGGISPYKFR
jgi:hypothetical protein